MITHDDLRQAIAECQGARNPNASTCIMLAAFLTIEEHMFGDKGASYDEPPKPSEVIAIQGSEFAEAIDGKPYADVLPVMDEIMDALSVICPKLYAAAIRKLYEA